MPPFHYFLIQQKLALQVFNSDSSWIASYISDGMGGKWCISCHSIFTIHKTVSFVIQEIYKVIFFAYQLDSLINVDEYPFVLQSTHQYQIALSHHVNGLFPLQ